MLFHVFLGRVSTRGSGLPLFPADGKWQMPRLGVNLVDRGWGLSREEVVVVQTRGMRSEAIFGGEFEVSTKSFKW